jgi:hypothetical protein
MKIDILQGDKPLYEGGWQPLATRTVRRDAKGTEVGGQLKANLPPGIYELGVNVRDARRKQTVRGAVEFAVEP